MIEINSIRQMYKYRLVSRIIGLLLLIISSISALLLDDIVLAILIYSTGMFIIFWIDLRYWDMKHHLINIALAAHNKDKLKRR